MPGFDESRLPKKDMCCYRWAQRYEQKCISLSFLADLRYMVFILVFCI